ncbi:MAG: DUF4491 family protein [Spirochaetes bacterium]|nr:DUF4491 family protein [Spirochaetota bacterium]MBN2770396.1 DUF4491 family protein [Spirochaetota bacterium]
MLSYNYSGVIIGLMTFLLIGILHPLVIKGEYHFGKRICIVFFILGLLSIIFSVLTGNYIISSFFGITGFMLLWSIREIFEQEKRVIAGRFPRNPKREYPGKIL